jgi:hypothetical protein
VAAHRVDVSRARDVAAQVEVVVIFGVLGLWYLSAGNYFAAECVMFAEVCTHLAIAAAWLSWAFVRSLHHERLG